VQCLKKILDIKKKRKEAKLLEQNNALFDDDNVNLKKLSIGPKINVSDNDDDDDDDDDISKYLGQDDNNKNYDKDDDKDVDKDDDKDDDNDDNNDDNNDDEIEISKYKDEDNQTSTYQQDKTNDSVEEDQQQYFSDYLDLDSSEVEVTTSKESLNDIDDGVKSTTPEVFNNDQETYQQNSISTQDISPINKLECQQVVSFQKENECELPENTLSKEFLRVWDDANYFELYDTQTWLDSANAKFNRELNKIYCYLVLNLSKKWISSLIIENDLFQRIIESDNNLNNVLEKLKEETTVTPPLLFMTMEVMNLLYHDEFIALSNERNEVSTGKKKMMTLTTNRGAYKNSNFYAHAVINVVSFQFF
jgi:hypothetical protein